MRQGWRAAMSPPGKASGAQPAQALAVGAAHAQQLAAPGAAIAQAKPSSARPSTG
ncbi:MAG: hypothetical protein U1E47_05880 [Rivihabitans pingtungensis]